LAAKRATIEARSSSIASDRDKARDGRPPQTTAQQNKARDAKPDDADEPASKAKPESKDKPAPTAAKDAKADKPADKAEPASGRDEHGRFLPKEGEPKPAAAAPADKAAPAPKDKPEPAADAAPAKPAEPKPEPKPEPRPAAEEDKGIATKYARLQLDVQRKDAELLKANEKAKKADEYEALVARVRGNVIDEDALEKLTGRSWEKLIRDVIEEESGVKFKAKTRLPPEMQRIQDELEQTLNSAKQREEAIAQRARDEENARRNAAEEERRATVRKQETELVRKMLDDAADKYPMSAAVPGMPERILQVFYQRWATATLDPKTGRSTFDPKLKPTEDSVLESMEASLIPQLSAIVNTERGLKALLNSITDAKTRELALQILGADKAPPSQPKTSPTQRSDRGNQATSEGPKTLSNKVTQDAPVDPAKPRTQEEKRAWQVEEFRKLRGNLPIRREAR
jgi:hypothetical protein